jgi:hypothetical protein
MLTSIVCLSLSLSMIKPNTLPLNGAAIAWAASLADSAEMPTDSIIILLIQYQRLLGEIHDFYQEERKAIDLSRLPMHAKRMTATLESWWLSVPHQLHVKCMTSFLEPLDLD